jgi:hypothetical protein
MLESIVNHCIQVSFVSIIEKWIILLKVSEWLLFNANKIGICCFSTKHAALRSKSKDGLADDQNNVSKWNDMLHVDCCLSELVLCK